MAKKIANNDALTLGLTSYLDEAESTFVRNGQSSRNLLFSLQDTDLSRLLYLLNNRWDDPAVNNGMHRIFSALQVINRRVSSPEVYRYFLQILSYLGRGVQGEAYSATIPTPGKYFNYGGIIAVKTQFPAGIFSDDQSLYREYLVGRELEKFNSPIFVKAYGIMNCTGSYLRDDTASSLSFCAKNLPVSIITQFVQGQKIAQMQITAEEFYKCFLLYLFTMKDNEHRHLTHHDPHSENVLYRRLPTTWAIPVNGQYIKTNIIPVILDYGLTRLDTKWGPIYPSGKLYEQNGITPDYAPMHDIYKFLCWAIFSKMEFFNQFRFIINFFHRNITPTKFRELRNRIYIVPNQFRNYPLSKFIDFLERSAPPQYKPSRFLSNSSDNLHVYGVYHDKIDFFSYIGLHINTYVPLRDTFQWFLHRTTRRILNTYSDEPILIKDLLRILPGEQFNLRYYLATAIQQRIPHYQNLYYRARFDTDQITILGYVGDIAINTVIYQKMVFRAINDMINAGKFDRAQMESYRVEISNLMKQLQSMIMQFYPEYQRYASNKVYENKIWNIYPPSLTRV